jgi:hypothetical protein
MVPRAGLEPAQSLDHEILSLARIPISPPRPNRPDSRICACLLQNLGGHDTNGQVEAEGYLWP